MQGGKIQDNNRGVAHKRGKIWSNSKNANTSGKKTTLQKSFISELKCVCDILEDTI